MKTLQEYSEEIRDNLSTPTILAELGMEASADYAFYSEMMMTNQLKKSSYFVEKKFEQEKPHSDAHIEKMWLQEPDGIEEIKLKFYMKGLEKIMAMIKNNNYIQNVEARNQI